MKYKIILGCLAIILPVSAMPQSGNAGLQRLLFPLRWIQAAEQCLVDTPAEIFQHYLAGDIVTAPRAARLLALCYYSESGLFTDGVFNIGAIHDSLRSHLGSHNLLGKLLDVFEEAAEAGNAAVGDFDIKAFAFHAVMVLPKVKNLFNAVFRIGSG